MLFSDDLAYQTESEKKSYGGGGGVAHRGSSKNRGHQSDLDEKNQGMYYCTLRKSKFFIEKKLLKLRPHVKSETLERRLNPALCVLQTYFTISL